MEPPPPLVYLPLNNISLIGRHQTSAGTPEPLLVNKQAIIVLQEELEYVAIPSNGQLSID